MTEAQRKHYSLNGVASPSSEDLEEIKLDQLRVDNMFNHRLSQNSQRRFTKLPRRFDAREKWPQCADVFNVIAVRNQ